MKKFICIALCVLMSAITLCSCGNSSGNTNTGASSAQKTGSDQSNTEQTQNALKKADFGWVKCDIPDGYRDEVSEDLDIPSIYELGYKSSRAFNFFWAPMDKAADMDEYISNNLEKNGGELEDTFEMGGHTWYPINRGLVRYYTLGNDNKVLYIAVFGKTKDDEAFKTIFNSIEIDFTQKGPSNR